MWESIKLRVYDGELMPRPAPSCSQRSRRGCERGSGRGRRARRFVFGSRRWTRALRAGSRATTSSARGRGSSRSSSRARCRRRTLGCRAIQCRCDFAQKPSHTSQQDAAHTHGLCSSADVDCEPAAAGFLERLDALEDGGTHLETVRTDLEQRLAPLQLHLELRVRDLELLELCSAFK